MMNVYYKFTGELRNGTPYIFTNSQYHCCFKELRDKFSPVLINTTHDKVNFKYIFKGEIPICGTFDPKTLNKNDFCYQCSKNGL